MELSSRHFQLSSSNRQFEAIFASPSRYFTENSCWVPLLIEVLQYIELSSNRSHTPSVVFFNILQLGSLDRRLFCLVTAVGQPANADVFPVFASLHPKSRPKSKSQKLQKKRTLRKCLPASSQSTAEYTIECRIQRRPDQEKYTKQTHRILQS